MQIIFTGHNIRLDNGEYTIADKVETIDTNPQLLSFKRMLELIFPEEKSRYRIADLGCLEGGYSVEFARMGFAVLGIDVRESNIACCRYVKENTNLPNLEFVQDDVWNIARYGTFDAILCCGLLYHLDRPKQFLQVLSEVTSKAIIINTHFSTGSINQRFNLSDIEENEGLLGRWFSEFPDEIHYANREQIRWASWDNRKSFWIKREYLLQAIRDTGFDLVLEQFDGMGSGIAGGISKGFYKEYERGTFIGVKIPSIPLHKTKPKVSVVIPCYKQAHFLEEAVASVVAQTFKDWECIIVNDGSPDDTSEVARKLVSKFSDKAIRLLEKENGGLSCARNAGISASEGQYWLPLDADDKIEPTFLEKTVKILDSQSTVGFVYSHIRHFGDQDDVYGLPEFDADTIVHTSNIACVCSLVRRAVWEQVGGYNAEMAEGYEDWDFWVGCIEKGWQGHRIPEPLFFYRKRKGSMLEGSNRKRDRLIASIVCNHPEMFSQRRIENARELLSGNRSEPGDPFVLIACTHFFPSIGGLETIAENLGNQLVKSGYNVDVATWMYPGRTSNIRRGVRIISLDPFTKNQDEIPVWMIQLRQLVLSSKYCACILLANPMNQIIWSLEKAIIPPSTKLFIQPLINEEGYSQWGNSTVFRSRLVEILKLANGVISLTRNGIEAQFLREENFSPIYLPNATSPIRPDGNFRFEYNIPPDIFLIIHVANLVPIKNQTGLLECLGKTYIDFKLVMIGHETGGEEYVTRVHNRVAADNRFMLIPGLPQEKVAAAMEAADLLVLASHGEVSPVTILEAMSHSKPWLATPQCGSVHDLAGGIVVPLTDFPYFVAALQSNSNLLKRLGQLGYHHWEYCFSWSAVIKEWDKLITNGIIENGFTVSAEVVAEMNEIILELNCKKAQYDCTSELATI